MQVVSYQSFNVRPALRSFIIEKNFKNVDTTELNLKQDVHSV